MFEVTVELAPHLAAYRTEGELEGPMIYHRHLPATPTPTFPGVQEVARWPEPTRVLVLTDKAGTRRLRVEMMDSDITSEALEGLVVVLGIVEALNPEPGASSEASLPTEPLQLIAAPELR